MIKSNTANLRKFRIWEGWSQLEMSKKVALSASSYCMIENGKLGVKPKTAKLICVSLNKSFDELFEIVSKKIAFVEAVKVDA